MTTYAQKYPIGQFVKPTEITQPLLTEWITIISALPQDLRKEIETLSDQQLDTPYRDGGWTVRQVVHHYADSHMNAFCRFKLALTEDNPVIKPYFEERWAEHPDGKTISVDSSLAILQGLHQRWTVLLESLRETDLQRTFLHPEHGREISLEEAIGMYAWHCRHHLAHITTLKKAKGWS
ncbi:YfiT family bacillithiol transferase [Sphingobacterium spiritivorum]|uniref:YfiT family bacillithiol transferase n=1 Tax=Sphingobacterium spiritivorum TaxID=258 RepID=UPI003F76E3E3